MASNSKSVKFAADEGADDHDVDEVAEREEGLMKQDLATLDVRTLTPLTPSVISRQATINVGTIGHVAHGSACLHFERPPWRYASP